ncbi:heme A synthase [Rhodobacteraceae bacterium RKSG542]|uniref:COX15/CtaA family protein n=1 Tax=Pseudovibrio flavus TaxID=2529854 RepID=UPI0012BCF55C|nr:COX15/CtaA family protein [Pseudovibrio flavus]MTI17347.1 heme A synthase [Pseudovibrio flavus]
MTDLHNPVLPEKIRKDRLMISRWLLLICVMIAAMVVVGGATRLTDSGLSITEWKPIHGAIPPLSHAEWMEEFDKYREIPQYKLINAGMSLEEFKFIFWWEWGHRLLGRAIGVVFFVPLVVFWARGQVEPWLKPRLVFALFMGGLQGAIGWWMVASGLVNRVDVSQYRLAVHLTVAFFLFAYLYYLITRLRTEGSGSPVLEKGEERYSGFAWFILILLFVQLFMGALVAGLNAGLTFNTWPLMDGKIIPTGLFSMSPWWLNFTENVMTVQFQHRMVAYILTAVIAYQSWRLMKGSNNKKLRRNAHFVAIAVVFQVILGIVTLLGHVPLDRALAHQGFAVVLLALCVEQVALLKILRPQAQKARAGAVEAAA